MNGTSFPVINANASYLATDKEYTGYCVAVLIFVRKRIIIEATSHKFHKYMYNISQIFKLDVKQALGNFRA